jgi:hypothetical protein
MSIHTCLYIYTLQGLMIISVDVQLPMTSNDSRLADSADSYDSVAITSKDFGGRNSHKLERLICCCLARVKVDVLSSLWQRGPFRMKDRPFVLAT